MLTAADSVLIPIQCEYYALEGLSQLLNTVKLVQRNFNSALAIDGVRSRCTTRGSISRSRWPTRRRSISARRCSELRSSNVRLAEAPSFGKPILLYDVSRWREKLPSGGAGVDPGVEHSAVPSSPLPARR